MISFLLTVLQSGSWDWIYDKTLFADVSTTCTSRHLTYCNDLLNNELTPAFPGSAFNVPSIACFSTAVSNNAPILTNAKELFHKKIAEKILTTISLIISM